MKAKTRRNNLSCLPPADEVARQHLKKNDVEKKKKITKTPLLLNRVKDEQYNKKGK